MEAAPGSYKPLVMAAATAPLGVASALPPAITEMDRALAILDPLPDSRNAGPAWRDAGVFYRSVGDRDPANAQSWYRKSLAMLLRSERIESVRDQVDRRENARRGRSGLIFLPAELYLELGRTWLRLSDPAQALAAFERGRAISSDPDLLQELAGVYRQQGNPRAAAATLVEAMGVDPSRSPVLTPALVDLYRQIDPAGCAVTHSGELDPACPMVQADICAATHNVMVSYLRHGQTTEAAAVRQSAVQDFNCKQ